MEAEIPDKLCFKIGEVARLTSLRPSILRYWETEFSELQPQKSRTGQRLYSRKEVDVVLDIKRLLYAEKLTIKGARRALAKRGCFKGSDQNPPESVDSKDLREIIEEVRKDLTKIRESL
jgi:DNA-binding transcriptional MerR regulator